MSIAEIRQLPQKEKFLIMEALWSDLISPEENFEAPSWHALELQKTEQELKQGLIQSMDWDLAKKNLLKRFE